MGHIRTFALIFSLVWVQQYVHASVKHHSPPEAMTLVSPLRNGKADVNADELRHYIDRLSVASEPDSDLNTVFRSLIRDLSHVPCANYASSRMLDELIEKFQVREAAHLVGHRVRENFHPANQQHCSLPVTLLYLSIELVLNLPDAELRTSALPLLTKSFRDLLDWIDANTEPGPFQQDILAYVLEHSPSLNAETHDRYLNLLEALVPVAELRDKAAVQNMKLQERELFHKRNIQVGHLRARSLLYLLASAGMASTATFAPLPELWLATATTPLLGLLADYRFTKKAVSKSTSPKPASLAQGVLEAISICEVLFEPSAN